MRASEYHAYIDKVKAEGKYNATECANAIQDYINGTIIWYAEKTCFYPKTDFNKELLPTEDDLFIDVAKDGSITLAFDVPNFDNIVIATLRDMFRALKEVFPNGQQYINGKIDKDDTFSLEMQICTGCGDDIHIKFPLTEKQKAELTALYCSYLQQYYEEKSNESLDEYEK